MGVLEPSNTPYLSRWFTVLKKDGRLRIIHDMQLVNKVRVRNLGVGPIVDEFAKMFAGRVIYSKGGTRCPKQKSWNCSAMVSNVSARKHMKRLPERAGPVDREAQNP